VVADRIALFNGTTGKLIKDGGKTLADLTTDFINVGGDIMTGHLALPVGPGAAQAVRKDYVDAAILAYAAPFDALAYNGMQINGSMEVSQEKGTGVGSTSSYVCDGWIIAAGGVPVIFGSQNTGSGLAGLTNFINVAVSTAQPSLGAAEHAMIYNQIEGYRISRLAWGTANAQPLTIGFWSCHQRTGTYSVSVRNSAFNRSCIATYTQNVSAAWEYKTVNIPGDTGGTWNAGNIVGMSVAFPLASGATFTAPVAGVWYGTNYIAAPGQVNGVATTSDVLRITGVVILPGTQAPTAAQSPLIMRPYDQELVTCQRYYESAALLIRSPITGMHYHWFRYIDKRAAPAVSLSTIVYNGGASAATVANPLLTGAEISFTNTTINGFITANCIADARL